MAISYVGKSTFASGTAGLTVAAVSGVAAGDLILLFVESENQEVFAPAGYLPVPGSLVSLGTAATTSGVRLTVFFTVSTGADATTAVVDSGNHTCAIKLAFRGVDIVQPFDATPVTGTKATASTSASFPGITTTTDKAWVVLASALNLDAASTTTTGTPTNANLSSLTERHDQTISSSNGGGLVLITGIKTTAGATGNTTATVTSTTQVYMTLALRDSGYIRARGLVEAHATGALTVETQFAEVVGAAAGPSGVLRLPIGCQAGDVVVSLLHNNVANVPVLPSGWTSLGTATATGSAARLVTRAAPDASFGWSSGDLPGFSESSNQVLLVYAEGNLLLVSSSSVYRLPDGGASGLIHTAGGSIYAAVHDGVKWVLAGFQTQSISYDAITWTSTEMPRVTVRGAAVGDGLLAFVGGTLSFSPSGEFSTWVPRRHATLSGLSLTKVGYADGLWVVGSSTGRIFTSSDTLTWTERTVSLGGAEVTCIVNGAGLWIATSSTGAWATSTDGLTWETQTSFTTSNGLFVVYAKGEWVATSGTTEIYRSVDGFNWVAESVAGTSSNMYAPVYYRDRFAVYGGSELYTRHYAYYAAAGNASRTTSVVYRGLDTDAPIGAVTSTTGSGTTITLPALSNASGSQVICYAGRTGNDVDYPPTTTDLVLLQSVPRTPFVFTTIAVYSSGGKEL